MNVVIKILQDVAGIVKDNNPILEYLNEKEEMKKQNKFSITDGRFTPFLDTCSLIF